MRRFLFPAAAVLALCAALCACTRERNLTRYIDPTIQISDAELDKFISSADALNQ